MKVLVVGSGGREHALAEAASRSPLASEVLRYAGDDVVAHALANDVGLVLVGPEGPLTDGLVDQLEAAGVPAFGPGAAAARLEASKAWAKAFMTRHGIPTAPYAVTVDPADAHAYVEALWRPAGLVVKADGLAAGKGVVVAHSPQEAHAAIDALSQLPAGRTLVLERKLEGEEVSYLAFLDGSRWLALPPARDHKALLDGGRGPNTGGMGVVAPVALPRGVEARIEERIMAPLLRGLALEGLRYRGVVFVGLMLAADGPQVLEFNCRFGDPEAQALLPGLDEDLVALALACRNGELGDRLKTRPGVRVCVVAAAPGYPGDAVTGLPIHGLAEAEAVPGVRVFHAATRRTPDGYVTAGGRVLNLVGEGRDEHEARARAYAALAALRFGDQPPVFRRDIGLVEALV